MSLEQARRESAMANSYSRLEIVMGWSPQTCFEGPKLRIDRWWRLLGEEWSTCDNIAEWSDVLRELMRRAPPRHLGLMMDNAEREALAKMPDELTIWRGCYPFNADGLSWSTTREVAARFPLLNRYRVDGQVPILIEARVRRQHAVLKLDRGESEVITWCPTVVATTPIDLPDDWD